ncbi:ribosomal protein, putative [Ichthyophthirius multifiliis]|uniref:Ribosomal protein, putative n=1 Tax=Ichthyophthirius multifiliis TaxID=5932 RepID=G0QT82_ICHMU|nr:ribosomal protein, putative [Ichthyophthirius multifiliis]EGR31576.1 ribosomal protein, putative [Ichthyophthirius multifiliis]|eukprot:XP_004035062.1 ribosomal protein, putative [Ichthyophthirius multifiliis]
MKHNNQLPVSTLRKHQQYRIRTFFDQAAQKKLDYIKDNQKQLHFSQDQLKNYIQQSESKLKDITNLPNQEEVLLYKNQKLQDFQLELPNQSVFQSIIEEKIDAKNLQIKISKDFQLMQANSFYCQNVKINLKKVLLMIQLKRLKQVKLL